MRTDSLIEHPLSWQVWAALALIGALLAIPTPVSAEAKKDLHALHPASPAIHGLLAHPREAGSAPRMAAPGKMHTPHARLDPSNKQLRTLPQHRVQGSRREAALARQLMLARLPRPDRPQKPLVLQHGQIRTIDGDTFAVGGERFRIRGMNAPETTESGGFDATQRLDLLLHDGPVLAIPYGQDTYGRTLVEVYVNNRNVADVMKEEGHDKQREGK
jgi:hypothetical protein